MVGGEKAAWVGPGTLNVKLENIRRGLHTGAEGDLAVS